MPNKLNEEPALTRTSVVGSVKQKNSGHLEKYLWIGLRDPWPLNVREAVRPDTGTKANVHQL